MIGTPAVSCRLTVLGAAAIVADRLGGLDADDRRLVRSSCIDELQHRSDSDALRRRDREIERSATTCASQPACTSRGRLRDAISGSSMR